MNNYTAIVKENLQRLFDNLPSDLDARLLARVVEGGYEFSAFGRSCRIAPEGILMDDRPETGVQAVLVSLYALHASAAAMQVEPLQSYKDFPGSMPYAGAFTTHAEIPLAGRVQEIEASEERILKTLQGQRYDAGDFAYMLRPLPKVAVVYVFYRADEDFPASVTGLFSKNANEFLPLDALADVGEYTSRRIIELL